MGLYRFKNDTTVDTTGIVRTADGSVIPNNSEHGAWREYLAWKAVPNTPDAAAVTTTLATYRLNAKQLVDEAAEIEFRKDTAIRSGTAPSCAAAFFAVVEEARRLAGDLLPSSGAYPLLSGLPSSFGAAYTDRGPAVTTLWNSIKTRVAATNGVRLKAHVDIDAAGSKSAVDTVLAAITWPA